MTRLLLLTLLLALSSMCTGCASPLGPAATELESNQTLSADIGRRFSKFTGSLRRAGNGIAGTARVRLQRLRGGIKDVSRAEIDRIPVLRGRLVNTGAAVRDRAVRFGPSAKERIDRYAAASLARLDSIPISIRNGGLLAESLPPSRRLVALRAAVKAVYEHNTQPGIFGSRPDRLSGKRPQDPDNLLQRLLRRLP